MTDTANFKIPDRSTKITFLLNIMNVKGSKNRLVIRTLLDFYFHRGLDPFSKEGRKQVRSEIDVEEKYFNTIINRIKKQRMIDKVNGSYHFNKEVVKIMKASKLIFNINEEDASENN